MDYKSNSHKSKAEGEHEKRVGKVVNGATKTRKKKEISKITDLIFAEDFGTVKEFIIYDVVIVIGNIFFSIIFNLLNYFCFNGCGNWHFLFWYPLI